MVIATEIIENTATRSSLELLASRIFSRWDSVIDDFGIFDLFYIQNLIDLEKGPLPESVVQAIDEAWAIVKGSETNYWHWVTNFMEMGERIRL